MGVTGEQIVPALFYLLPTDVAVPWDVIRDIGHGYPALNSKERCEFLLRAVNRESPTVGEWKRFAGAPLSKALSDKIPMPLYDPAIAAVTKCLLRIIEDWRRAQNEIAANVDDIVNGEYITVRRRTTVGGVRVIHDHVVSSSPAAAVAYALGLLLDPVLNLGRYLRRCGWHKCGRFELIEPPRHSGQPPTFYCSDDHRKQDVLRQARERVAAKRAGVSVAKYRAKQARKSK